MIEHETIPKVRAIFTRKNNNKLLFCKNDLEFINHYMKNVFFNFAPEKHARAECSKVQNEVYRVIFAFYK